MVTFVLICNGVIVLFNCYLVWRLLKFRKTLNQLANTLERLEKIIPQNMKLTVLLLRQSEYQALILRQRYGLLQQKWEKLLVLIRVLKWLYQRNRA